MKPTRTITYRLDQPQNTCTFTLTDMDDGILIQTLYGTALVPLNMNGDQFDFIDAFREFTRDINLYLVKTYPPSHPWGEES